VLLCHWYFELSTPGVKKVNELAKKDVHEVLNAVITKGDLSKLTDHERTMYVKAVCESIGLNPLTRPFEYMTLQGKTVLYARKDATEQLRKINNISIEIKCREFVEDCYIVTAVAMIRGHGRDERKDESIGAVSIAGLKGEARANAMMKAETKAKRRVTLSISGLGMLDEHEVETVPGAHLSASSPVQSYQTIYPDTLQELKSYMEIRQTPQATIDKWYARCGVDSLDKLPELFAQNLVDKMRTALSRDTILDIEKEDEAS
jgi:hypothetical protein